MALGRGEVTQELLSWLWRVRGVHKLHCTFCSYDIVLLVLVRSPLCLQPHVQREPLIKATMYVYGSMSMCMIIKLIFDWICVVLYEKRCHVILVPSDSHRTCVKSNAAT